MRLLAPLSLLVWQAIAQITTPTYGSVQAQIEAFQDLQSSANFPTRITPPSRFSGCSLACAFLAYTLPSQVSFPNSTIYQYEKSRYWSQQQFSAAPTCRFSPTSSLSVSLAVLTVQFTRCKFAVKSGGHGAFYGASNIDSGLTIDLLKLNQVKIADDEKTTEVGAGNRWVDVYSVLDQRNLSVIGGRVADIGVGGLTLGGGISFFSARYGWACDNVAAYEVVFADGSINNITYTTHPDLYFALRGGGNNFGIVTKFTLFTFPQGPLWAGSETYILTPEVTTSLNNALYWLNINTPNDIYGQVILAYAYAQSLDTYVAVSDLQYGKPVPYPEILSNFTDTPGAVANTLNVTSLTDLTIQFNNSTPGGFRQTYWALMTQNSLPLLNEMTEIFIEGTDNIKNVTGVVPDLIIQSVTTSVISHFSENGGNALGITEADGPLILLNIAIAWSLTSDDDRVMAAARAITTRINATAYAQDLGHPYIYQNYATQEQPVFESYGQENLERLRQVSKRYDPTGVWQKLQPGYFKVF